MTSWNQAVVVFRKEIKDAFRDRRAIASILFGAIVGPIMVGFMLNRAGAAASSPRDHDPGGRHGVCASID